MTAAPAGERKADAENTDAAVNAAAEKKAAAKTPAKKTTTRKSTSGSPKEGDKLPQSAAGAPVSGGTDKANPEAVSRPGDEQQTNTNNDNGPEQFEVPPAVPGPNDPIPEGVVEVTHKAKEGEPSDPGGNVTERAKAKRATRRKSDPLKGVDLHKLPIAVAVGQITATVEAYAGNAVLALSLVGWVGDAPLKIRAEDISDIEDALESLREQLDKA